MLFLPLVYRLERQAALCYDPRNAPQLPSVRQVTDRPMSCAYCPEGNMTVEEANVHATAKYVSPRCTSMYA